MMQSSMRERTVVIGVIVVLLVFVSIAAGALWLGVLTGRAIETQEAFEAPDTGEKEYDVRGFIGVCGEEECVTVPTLIQKVGEAWQLGFYSETQGADGTPRLAYRNTRGEFMTVEEAFAGE